MRGDGAIATGGGLGRCPHKRRRLRDCPNQRDLRIASSGRPTTGTPECAHRRLWTSAPEPISRMPDGSGLVSSCVTTGRSPSCPGRSSPRSIATLINRGGYSSPGHPDDGYRRARDRSVYCVGAVRGSGPVPHRRAGRAPSTRLDARCPLTGQQLAPRFALGHPGWLETPVVQRLPWYGIGATRRSPTVEASRRRGSSTRRSE
jgi:hypothetical protein